MWQNISRAFLELLAPRSCPGCDLPYDNFEAESLCGACEPLLEMASEAFAPPAPIATVFVYGGPIAEAIRRLKYRGRSDFARPLGKLLCNAAFPYAGLIDVVMPVPLYPARLRARGYNQAALLARPVARRLGLPFDVMSLSRVRATAEQAGIAKTERVLNVKDAFAARRPRAPARVLLIDDVRTTGATLAAASQALLAAGYSSVHTLTLASAPPG